MPAEPGEALSEREIEVVRLVAAGLSNKEIATQLYVSPNTVKVHLRNIFTKTGVTSRTELTMMAVRAGWVVISSEGEKAALATAAPQTEAPASPAPAGTDRAAATMLPEPEGSAAPEAVAAVPLEAQPDAFPQAEASTATPWPRHRWLALGLGLAAMLLILFLPAPRKGRSAASSLPGLIDAPSIPGAVATETVPRWEERAPMSVRRARLGLAAWGGQLYAMGGLTAEGVTALTERYDPERDRWTSVTPRPLALANLSAASLKAGILVPGGCDAQGRPYADVHLYDPRTDTWRAVASLPQALCGYTLTTAGEQVYLFGGWDGTRYTTAAYRYDPARDLWETLAPAPTARGFGGAAAYGESVYYVGGYDGERELATCEVYTPAQDRWDTCPRLLQPRGGLNLVQAGAHLYAIGGGWQHYLGFNERYDVQTQRWQVVETPLVGEWRHAGVSALGASLYAVGGWNGDYLNRTYRFDVLPFQIYVPVSLP